MTMLSRILRFELVDAQQQRAKLRDLGTAVLDSEYPAITCLLFRNQDNQDTALAWEHVRSFDLRAGRITVDDLQQGQPVLADAQQGIVWLCRDILDALVIDLQNRRATRANDLWLEQEDGQLCLKGADTSARAILRRLSRGRFGLVRKSGIYDWKYIEFLRGDPHARQSGTGEHLRIQRLPVGEIARLTDPLPYLHAAELLTLLPDKIAADTLEIMSPERQLQVFEELDEAQALRLLELMAPDIAADLVGRLEPDTARRYLNHLSRKQSERIVELLRYPETTVGGIMTNDVVSIAADMTVAQARRVLCDRLKEPDFVHFIYVVADETSRKLRGVVSLREIFIAEETRKVEDLMNPYVVSLQPLGAAREAAYQVITSGLAALPVIGSEARLIGAVTVDAAVALAAPATWGSQAPRIFS